MCVLIYMWTYFLTYHIQNMWESKNMGMIGNVTFVHSNRPIDS